MLGTGPRGMPLPLRHPKDRARDCREHLILHTHFPDEAFEAQGAEPLAQSLLAHPVLNFWHSASTLTPTPDPSLKLAWTVPFLDACAPGVGVGRAHQTSTQLRLSLQVQRIRGRWSEDCS